MQNCIYLFIFIMDLERRSPDQHINGRAKAERADAKRKGSDSIAVHMKDKTMGTQSSPENSPAPARSKSPHSSAYHDPSPIYKRFLFSLFTLKLYQTDATIEPLKLLLVINMCS